jgi:hypothetical protein
MTYSALPTTDAGQDASVDGHVPIRRFGRRLTATLLKRCGRLLPNDWRILLWSEETDETVIDSYGAVEIHRVPPCCTAQTCVKGEMDAARGTAVQRLAKYVGGDNRRTAALAAERPVLQQQMAPGLWLVTIRLPSIDDAHSAPMPRTPKVKIASQEGATWAVVTMSGQTTERAVARAEAAILEAIARTPWFRAGSPVVRLHVPSALLPFAGCFEVAIPVAHLSDDNVQVAPTSRPASTASRPVH